jgi:hypothetical protein
MDCPLERPSDHAHDNLGFLIKAEHLQVIMIPSAVADVS